MTAALAARLRGLLADPGVAEIDPFTIERVRRRLVSGDDPPGIDVRPHGSIVVREGSRGRRVLELDRNGALLATLAWADDERLAHAWVRVADDSWVMIEPRAAEAPPWGRCDRLWHAAHPARAAHVPLTLLEALAYEAIDHIPVVLEPARLPPGAGAAVLNLIAGLAADAGRQTLAYRGPYPTEQLFLSLLEAFRYETAEADPLGAFMSGRVRWRPAPHERACPAPGVTVHLRGRVEKVLWQERLYHRPDWQGIRRHAPRRVRDADGAVLCSLWALGQPVEDHLRLDAEGARVEIIAPLPLASFPRAMPRAVLTGVAAAAAALSAPPLAAAVREVAGGLELRWAAVEGDLVAVERDRVSVSSAFRDVFRRRLRAAATRADRLGLALGVVTELAHLVGDALRARAQARLANLPSDVQARLLARPDAEAQPDTARRITEAVDALLADAEAE